MIEVVKFDNTDEESSDSLQVWLLAAFQDMGFPTSVLVSDDMYDHTLVINMEYYFCIV